MERWVPIIRDCIQVLFFLVIGAVTILTYLKAKKTILQPIRTEIFKEQLKVFSTLLTMFSGRDELELRNDLGTDKLFLANATWLMDQYARHFFDLEVDENKRPYGREACPITIIPEKYLEHDTLHLMPGESSEKPPKGTPATKAAVWAKYKFDLVKLPKEYTARRREIERIIASPLVPKNLAQLLLEYLVLARKNVEVLRLVLTSCASELPEKYPDLETMKKASMAWINNRYNNKFQALEPKAGEITEFLRNYFEVERIMEVK